MGAKNFFKPSLMKGLLTMGILLFFPFVEEGFWYANSALRLISPLSAIQPRFAIHDIKGLSYPYFLLGLFVSYLVSCCIIFAFSKLNKKVRTR